MSDLSDPYAQKPWLKHYDPQVPEFLKYPQKTYMEVVRETTAYIPARTAVYYMGRGLTFHELDIFSNQLAHFLIDSGLKPGDTVGVNLPNIPAYYISILAVQKAGCVLTGVSPLLPPKELEYQLKDSGAKLLVTLDALLAKVAAVVGRTEVKTLAAASIADFLSPLKRALGRLLKKIPGGKIRPISGVKVVRFSDVLKRMPSDRIEEKLEPSAACLMQYTGGTTGPPKGAVLTHRNIVCQLHQVSTWLDIRAGEESTLISAFPLFHQAGLFLGMTGFAVGASQVAVPNPRDLNFQISALKTYKPKGVVNVPTIYLELLKKPAFRALDFSGVEWFISGAAPFPPEYIREFEEVGWIYTGDVCRMDEDGYFYVVDQVKDMVIVSGYKVFTRAVDDVLMEHPDVDVAATIGLPDPNRPGSEIVATAVVLKPWIEKSDAAKEEITRYMRGKVAPYKVPKRIEFMDELPLSPVGKVLKRELRQMMQ
ncbi:MAG: AMP-binding protein [Desulfobacterales bacterium]